MKNYFFKGGLDFKVCRFIIKDLLHSRLKQGKVFESLEGVLHINSRYWAVQQVRVKAANPLNLKVKLDQQYVFVPTARDSGHWFPEQLNFELEYDKYPNPMVGMRIIGRSYITDVAINLFYR